MADNNSKKPKTRELTVADIDPTVEELIKVLQQHRVPSTIIVGTALLQIAVMQLQVNHKQELATIHGVVDRMFTRNKGATMESSPSIIVPKGRLM